MFTAAFWKAATERALRTVAQTLLSTWLIGDVALDALSINWGEALGVALGAGLIAYLTSIAAVTASPATGPSLGTEVPAPSSGTEVPDNGAHRDTGAIDVGTAVVIAILVLLVLLVLGVVDVAG